MEFSHLVGRVLTEFKGQTKRGKKNTDSVIFAAIWLLNT
jgi:hypothetical protein